MILVLTIGFEFGADMPLSIFSILMVLLVAIITSPVIEPRKESE